MKQWAHQQQQNKEPKAYYAFKEQFTIFPQTEN